jgi:uncharacterized membrane protein
MVCGQNADARGHRIGTLRGTMYEILVFLHVLSAVIWVGGAITGQLLAVQISRSDDPADLPKYARQIAVLGNRLFLPAALVIIVTGVVMTIQAYSFEQLWIAVAIVLWVLSAALGAVYVGPRIAQATKLFDAEGPTSEAGRQKLNQVLLAARLELLSFLVIIGLMVFKPGA